MATTFPVNTYPLLSRADADIGLGVVRDLMQDGSPRLRQVNLAGYTTITLEFAPLREADAKSLIAYIRTHATDEMEVAVGSVVYVGYFWGDIEQRVLGSMHWLSIEFYGR